MALIYIYIKAISFRPTNNNGCYRYADKAIMPVFCKYVEKNKKTKIKIKNKNKKQINK